MPLYSSSQNTSIKTISSFNTIVKKSSPYNLNNSLIAKLISKTSTSYHLLLMSTGDGINHFPLFWIFSTTFFKFSIFIFMCYQTNVLCLLFFTFSDAYHFYDIFSYIILYRNAAQKGGGYNMSQNLHKKPFLRLDQSRCSKGS